jgi:aspartate/methionine/tyrosine aminotransferase
MFSTRTPGDMTPNPLSAAIARKRAAGSRLLDLTESNPTRAGIDYPAERILSSLAAPGALVYEPDPRGLALAREAVAGYYAARGVAVDPGRVLLTASTSEAYALLFKVLADPRDEVLVPMPSYPLFEHLARVEAVEPVPYPLGFDGAWHVDAAEVRARVTPRTRAVVVVSPNNPTGSALTRDDLAALVEVCADANVALVCDEVFADYVVREDPRLVRSVAETSGALVFALSGLSKVAALPQLKLGWIAANGPPGMLDEALSRLEFAADLFLSVASPVQHALPELLALAPEVSARVRERVAANRAWLESQACGESACRVMPSDGGWYAVVRVPRVVPEERMVVDLVERDDVVVHPGYFFDFAREGLLVVSLLPRPEAFRDGASRILAYVERETDLASR